MLCVIEQLLDRSDCIAMLELVSGHLEDFESGANTAGWHARQVKNNEQLASYASDAICDKTSTALLGNPTFQSIARPKRIAKIMLSRYRPGMHYGMHVDDAFIDGERTDLSFTLFLSEPTSYDGGELVIDSDGSENMIKLPPGSVIVYPSTTLHKVEQVTRGERFAIVGWVRSHVRNADERALLLDVDQAIASAQDGSQSRDLLARLLKIKMNLLRKWSEG